jgi:hypothetical protein
VIGFEVKISLRFEIWRKGIRFVIGCCVIKKRFVVEGSLKMGSVDKF